MIPTHNIRRQNPDPRYSWRFPQTPRHPTFKELGYKDIEGVGWNGIVAPPRLPNPSSIS